MNNSYSNIPIYLIAYAIIFIAMIIRSFIENENSYILNTIKRLTFFFRHKSFAKYSFPRYTLFNKNIIIIYEKWNDIITLYELKKRNRRAVVNRFQPYSYLLNIETFDDIMYNFYFDTTFDEVLKYFITNNIDFNITSDKRGSKPEVKPILPENKMKIDINSADEKELSLLPGINIVTAKKIIKTRDLKGGFKTKEEFYEQLKLKKHFMEKIKEIIEIKEYSDINSNQKPQGGRVVDF